MKTALLRLAALIAAVMIALAASAPALAAPPADPSPPPTQPSGANPPPFLQRQTISAAKAGQPSAVASFGLQSGQPYWYWSVMIQGYANSYPFQVQGWLLMTPKIDQLNVSDARPYDFFLIAGSPAATPETGAIWLATNSGYFSLIGSSTSASQLNLTSVVYDGSTNSFFMQVDPNIAAAAIFNIFSSSPGVVGDVWMVRDGQMQLQFAPDWSTVGGQVGLLGTGWIYYASAPYSASISGTYVGMSYWP